MCFIFTMWLVTRKLCQIVLYDRWRFTRGKSFITNLAGNTWPLLSQNSSKERKCLWLNGESSTSCQRKCHSFFFPSCKESRVFVNVLGNNIWKYIFFFPVRKFLRVLPLPSENWSALVEEWCCHPNPFARSTLLPQHGDCFLGDTFLLLNSRNQSYVPESPKCSSETEHHASQNDSTLVK